MELFCTALAADCSNSAMQAAEIFHIKTYLTSAENCNECDDFIASTVAKMSNYSALFQQTAVTLQCKRLQYSYIKTYLTSAENCNECDDDFIASTVAKIWNYSALHLQQTAVSRQCKRLWLVSSKHS